MFRPFSSYHGLIRGKGAVFFMHGTNPIRKLVGVSMVAIGLLILFARVLPAGFWWFCVGAGLVAGGVCLLSVHR